MKRPALRASIVVTSILACAAVVRAQTLRVLDIDAHYLADDQAGAVLDFDAASPSSSAATVLAAADAGAPFELVLGVAVSHVTGITYVSDPGVGVRLPRIHAVDCAGVVSLVAEGAPLARPSGLAFLPDGRLLIADPEADPSGLGPDDVGGLGHGAILVVDVASCAPPCMPALLSDGARHSFGGGVASSFQDPMDVVYDAVRERLYVVDMTVPGRFGGLLAVDPATGMVDLVSSPDWSAPFGVSVRSDGRPLVCDAGATPGTSSLWEIDPAQADPDANATLLSGGAQYAQLQDVTRDADGTIFAVDWGEYDDVSGTFIEPPALFRVDEGRPNPLTNGVLVNDSVELVTPIGITVVSDCAPPPGLAINRGVTSLETRLMRLQFLEVARRRPPWHACPDEIVTGAADGLRLAGEATPSAAASLRFYEHSDPVANLRIERDGSDLIVRAP